MTRRQFPDCMHAIPELGTVDAGKGASSIALPSSLIISNGLTICDSRNFFFFFFFYRTKFWFAITIGLVPVRRMVSVDRQEGIFY